MATSNLLNIRGNYPDFSFGFEVEFRDCEEAKREIFHFVGGERKVRTEKFPFLDGTWIQEESGNYEVRSKPYIGANAILGNTTSDMWRMREVLGDYMASFHLHIRFPISLVPRNKEEDFNGWIARMADYVLFWRLQKRKEWFALSAWCMTRLPITYMTEKMLKGPVRFQKGKPDFRDHYDIEIRGFMREVSKIEELTQILMTGVTNKSYKGYYKFQEHSSRPSQQEKLVDFFQRNRSSGCLEVTASRRKTLENLEANASRMGRGNVVLFDFENAPFFSQEYRRKIVAQNTQFVKDFNSYFRSVEAGDYEGIRREQYRKRLKEWAVALDLQSHLKQSLL